MEMLPNPNLRLTENNTSELNAHMEQLNFEKANQCLHSHKDCLDYLSYYLKTSSPDENGNKRWVKIAPDYSLLVQQLPADGPNDFDTQSDALKLGALELAYCIVENLSMEIAWADQRGREWRDTAVFRLMFANH
ncbi:MAG: hypothetical protein COB40_13570 [Marinosulfonomonas sp.]|nr:MAG: hypothetical protein COB40_13570 [Marinosulfonomonas sp.]